MYISREGEGGERERDIDHMHTHTYIMHRLDGMLRQTWVAQKLDQNCRTFQKCNCVKMRCNAVAGVKC